jgi:hypothetical protein
LLPDVSKKRIAFISNVTSPWFDSQPWGWTQYISSELLEQITQPHDTTTQKTFLNNHATETSNKVFVLLRICLFFRLFYLCHSLCFLCAWLIWKYEPIIFFIIFGRFTLLRNYWQPTQQFDSAFLTHKKNETFWPTELREIWRMY